MKNYFSPLMMTAVVVLASCTSRDTEPRVDSKYASFVGGITLIENASVSPERKNDLYARLCECTGVNGTQARAFLRRFRNDPAAWETFQKKVHRSLGNEANE